MLTTIQTTTTILPNGRIELTNLAIPTGEVVNLVIFLPKTTTFTDTAAKRSVMNFLNPPPVKPKKRLTARSLLDSGLLGLWKDRTDIEDSAEYARQLREQSQQRGGGGQ
jgi:hypothetical protein